MQPSVRRALLTVHVIGSVGWFGAIVAYLALAIAAVRSPEPDLMRGAYLSMEIIAWRAIVPLCLVAFATGVWQALATEWGLFRHYWIVAKLALTTVATIILLLHLPAVSRMARLARETPLPLASADLLPKQLLVHAAGGLVVVAIITAISISKPWGRIPIGRA